MTKKHGPNGENVIHQAFGGKGHQNGVSTQDGAAAVRTIKTGSNGGYPAYDTWTEDELYRKARDLDIPGRSYMDRDALIKALRNAEH